MRLLRRPAPTVSTPAQPSTSATAWYVQSAAGPTAIVRAQRAGDAVEQPVEQQPAA